ARDRNTRSVDIVAIGDMGNARHANNPKTRDLIAGVLRDLPTGVSPANAAQALLELKRHNAGLELAAAIAKGDTKKQAQLLSVYGELWKATDLGNSKRQVKYEL